MTNDEDHGGLITVTVKRACEISGLSHTTIYRLIGLGKLISLKIGRRTLVTHASLRGLLDPVVRDSAPPAASRVGTQVGIVKRPHQL